MNKYKKICNKCIFFNFKKKEIDEFCRIIIIEGYIFTMDKLYSSKIGGEIIKRNYVFQCASIVNNSTRY